MTNKTDDERAAAAALDRRLHVSDVPGSTGPFVAADQIGFKAGYLLALAEQREIDAQRVEEEHLHEALRTDSDITYDQAITDAAAAIRNGGTK